MSVVVFDIFIIITNLWISFVKYGLRTDELHTSNRATTPNDCRSPGDLNAEDIEALDEFIASFGCSPSQPHPCSKYADPIFI